MLLVMGPAVEGLAVDESQSRSVNQSLHDNGETCTPGGETQCGDNKHCEMIGNKAFCKCNPGYHLEKNVCEDINECNQREIRQKCKPTGATCHNTPGSYKCRCKKGFEMGEHHCEDIDECDSWICHEKAICQNTRGSYTCTCALGFAGDGHECVVDKVYKQKQKIKQVVMFGGASAGGALFIIALIACCCCARKRKKKEEADEQKVTKMESTLSQYGEDWESSESSEDGDA